MGKKGKEGKRRYQRAGRYEDMRDGSRQWAWPWTTWTTSYPALFSSIHPVIDIVQPL